MGRTACHHQVSQAKLRAQKDILIRNQILVGTNSELIRNETLRKQWSLPELVKEGRITEASLIAASDIKSECTSSSSNQHVYRASPYSSKGANRKSKPKLRFVL